MLILYTTAIKEVQPLSTATLLQEAFIPESLEQ